jgi:hypothetical protein
MSTIRRAAPREDDRLVGVLSSWLMGDLGDEALRRELGAADSRKLSPDQAAAVDELLEDLDRAPGRGELQRSVRETLEALALG